MTVYKIGKNKIKIALSDNEVLAYFGAYEKIASMSQIIKLKISALLEESLADYGISVGDDKLLVEISAAEHLGCEITISLIGNKRSARNRKATRYMIEFSDTESLTGGIMYLYRNNRYKNSISHLFKMSGTYRLIILTSYYKNLYLQMNEFCIRQSESPYEIAYTEEHGKLLIKENAIKTYGLAFSKTF